LSSSSAQTSTATPYAAQAANTGYQQQTYQEQTYQQTYQPAAVQPAAVQPADDSALNAFIDTETSELLASIQPVQAVAPVSVEPVQAAVEPVAVPAQPVQAPQPVAEPEVVQQWTDDSGHTWRVMSDSTHRWWNGTDWQKV
jgi:hypothetical protein